MLLPRILCLGLAAVFVRLAMCWDGPRHIAFDLRAGGLDVTIIPEGAPSRVQGTPEVVEL